ncbi:sodium:solute symporter family transporter [Lignipirellula cremea]|uniref:Sodium/glucose cotransporter n=1 Tax=Lignipirellula cremea TaxID=2528010 RepID=A0A518E2H2_9BACT|nr:sodium/solute symporter [Lignipirellula cremea]QDU98291.1 Sodium/glucose cotransporter [Lignipirellula cremea]
MLLDTLICVVYLAVVFGIGLWCSRGQHNNEDYFVGGRRMHWMPIGLSIFAGTFSALSFVGLPKEAAYDDNYQIYVAIMFIPLVVTPIVCWLFLPLYFRLKVTSCYEYLGLRFHPGVQKLASLLYGMYTILWMGNMLVAVGKILQEVMQLNDWQLAGMLIGVGLFATLYTSIGGVKAVVWTDALQAFALGLGMLFVLYCAMGKIDGGVDQWWQVAQEHNKFQLMRLPTSWSDLVGSANIYSVCAFGFFVYLAGHAVQFTAVQRYVSMPSIQAARKSLIVNGLMVSSVCLLFFMVGTTLFVYYQQTGGSDYASLAAEGKGDQLLPRFIVTVIPQFGMAGLLLAGLFAAAMSSIDSGINSLTATVVCDWLAGRHPSLRTSRLLCFGFGLATIVAALALQAAGGDVFHVLMQIAGTFLGVLLGLFLLGMLVRRANTPGALAGMATGLLCVAAAGPLGVSEQWYGAISCLPTLLAGWLVSYAFAPPTARQMQAN